MTKPWFALALLPLGIACVNPTVEEGGANGNDRTFVTDGEELLTGAMVVSPSGKFIVLQRNDISVVFDVTAKKYTEVGTQLKRVAFAHGSEVAFAHRIDGAIVMLDLPTATIKWVRTLEDSSVSLLRTTEDDKTLIVGDSHRAILFEAASGAVLNKAELGSKPSALTFLKKRNAALVVGTTAWDKGAPKTRVALLDIDTASVNQIDVPNCDAPLVVTPDESRAFLSPTFCDVDHASNPNEAWTNPDPVSVINLGDALQFQKNLPGFGPVAMSPDGKRVVAYLDTKRMDKSMFDQPSIVPSESGPEYHIMVIDPQTLSFSLSPIGNALPRLAMTRSGKGLLVDASIKVKTRMKASAAGSISIGPNGISGEVSANVQVFDEQSPFGYFDLESLKFQGFTGPQAGLDRFVQLADGKHVVTLQKRTDGLGGIPYLIDLETRATSALSGNFGSGVRDVGIMPDGANVLFRVRLPAGQHENKYWSREGLLISSTLDFSGELFAQFEASTSFADVQSANDCRDYHDCL